MITTCSRSLIEFEIELFILGTSWFIVWFNNIVEYHFKKMTTKGDIFLNYEKGYLYLQ